ncbi:putative DNA binding domain-containing protein [Maribacter sp. TH_r10]|uniref:AlbA family DNA-binding domain-containing protein n=1 Tax=Maribacter sp. TH_r10 TaxID=3082086 RepID=UPI0029556858|nr:RNA-binding domain-containing protein [Maribacter sp. TH_r10]MDV7137269.1 putative DNA binding domain-containing protein [Maribacter sp. TH_r10]
MLIERLKHIIEQGEGTRTEYKEARSKLPKNLFESICAMLNRDGGDIVLGVTDSSVITGVDKKKVEELKNDLVTLSNNPNKLDPPFILFPQVYEIENESIIHIQVPASSQMHKSAGHIYDRSNDGDFKVGEPQLIADIYNRKRNHYSEGTIYPFVQLSNFNSELFTRARKLIWGNNQNHPWLSLSDEQLLQKAGLWKKDFATGKEGYTLAAILLFGKDETIQQILPHYKIDALVRKDNVERFDDRLYCTTNLIDAYDQLMDFAAKHLSDPFFLEGTQRRSLRGIIFREIIVNMIVHREYTNAQSATFIIYRDRVETENANNPHGEGVISPINFSPFPKNPSIAKFFMQLGRFDELGSGILNVNKYIEAYSGKDNPQFIEGATFKTIIPVPIRGADDGGTSGANEGAIEGVIEGAVGGVTDGVKERLALLLTAIADNEGKRVPDYKEKTNLPESSIERYIAQLRNAGLIEFRGNAPQTGGYFLKDNVRQLIEKDKM